MIGFKATTADMTCRGYQFSLGVHKHKGRIKSCVSGFHFCKELKSVFQYYNEPGMRLFKVKAIGQCIEGRNKVVTDEIEFLEEIKWADIAEELKNDDSWSVRIAVANQGYFLEELKNDRHWMVREAVANQGYALEELKNDKDWMVRRAVARKGYALEELKDDHHWMVRATAEIYGEAKCLDLKLQQKT